jgi:uncharacterized membrane protein (DUF485 family)
MQLWHCNRVFLKNLNIGFLTPFTIIVIVIHILKLIYLWFKPRFLNEKVFGPTTDKLMLSIYYLLTILVLTAITFDKFNVIQMFPNY